MNTKITVNTNSLKTQLDENNYLTILLLRYDEPSEQTERYYFLEMSTLQVTTLLLPDSKITTVQIEAYTDDHNYPNAHTINGFQTIGDFNAFFLNNPDFYIYDCHIELENGIKLSSHDDGEVSIQFPNEYRYHVIIDWIFEKYNIDKKLIRILKNKPGHYFAIDEQNRITDIFENFEEYLKSGQS